MRKKSWILLIWHFCHLTFHTSTVQFLILNGSQSGQVSSFCVQKNTFYVSLVTLTYAIYYLYTYVCHFFSWLKIHCKWISGLILFFVSFELQFHLKKKIAKTCFNLKNNIVGFKFTFLWGVKNCNVLDWSRNAILWRNVFLINMSA